MGKPASNDECRKQVKLIERYETDKENLAIKTRENNKKLMTAQKHLQCMVTGEDPDLFNDGKDADADD